MDLTLTFNYQTDFLSKGVGSVTGHRFSLLTS